MSPDGLILTNDHVVDSEGHREQLDRWAEQAREDGDDLSLDLVEDRFVILFSDQDGQPTPRYEAEVAASDPRLDLAVLRITAGRSGEPLPRGSLDLPFVPLGDSDSLTIGDPLEVFSYPGVGGDSLTNTRGIVAGFLKEDGVSGRAWIKTDASMSGGSSGGTAVDRAGFLVGIPTQGAELDCRPGDTNGDGKVDVDDVGCRPVGGSIGQMRPVNLAKPLIDKAGGVVREVAVAPAPEAPTAVSDDEPASVGPADRDPAEPGLPTFDAETYCLSSPVYRPGEVLLLSREISMTGDSSWPWSASAGSELIVVEFLESGVCDKYRVRADGSLFARNLGTIVLDERLLRRQGAPTAYEEPKGLEIISPSRCRDFSSFEEAQAYFHAHGGPLYDPLNLDPNGDGIICAGMP